MGVREAVEVRVAVRVGVAVGVAVEGGPRETRTCTAFPTFAIAEIVTPLKASVNVLPTSRAPSVKPEVAGVMSRAQVKQLYSFGQVR